MVEKADFSENNF